MDTTSANYEIYDTLFTVFLTLYISLLAVIATEFCDGKWRRKKQNTEVSKDAAVCPKVKDGTLPSQATKDED